jgi:hypothetical protein
MTQRYRQGCSYHDYPKEGEDKTYGGKRKRKNILGVKYELISAAPVKLK